MKKILFLATYGDFLATFEYSNISIWKSLGATVYCASNFSNKKYNLKTKRLDTLGVKRYELEFDRKPFSIRNLHSFAKLKKFIIKENIDIIDCHNAVVGAYARVAAKQCGIKKVIYTPHGFFFYNGAPAKNNIFKLVEYNLARVTDILVTINKEDYIAAQKMPLRGKALYIPGIGVNTKRIKALPKERKKYRQELGIPLNSKIYISVGELIPRKDHETAIRAFAKAHLENAYYIIAGIGKLKLQLQELINKLGMSKKVILVGYRQDIWKLLRASDVFLFPSLQEGLPVSVMEAMASGLPCIVSKIRGNVDLIDEKQGGYLFNCKDVDELSLLIKKINFEEGIRKSMGAYNQKKSFIFDEENVSRIMTNEYRSLIGE